MPSRVDPDYFKDHYLFSALDSEELARVADAARIRRLAADETLFFQGDQADRFFLVRRGQIKLARLTPEGNEKVVDIFGPHQTFAEGTLFMKKRRYPVTASAVEEAEVIGFSSRHFLDLLATNTGTCIQLLGDLTMRLQRRLREIEHLSMKNASYRVVHFLLNELDTANSPDGKLQLRLQKQVIASRLSIKPETLSRIFQSLREENILEAEGRTIRIKDIEALRNYY